MRFPPWYPQKTDEISDYNYCVDIIKEVDIWEICFLEILQTEKNELLIPIASKNRSEVTFSEYDLLDRIEKDINQGTYMLYAQRRFAKDVGTRNVKVADDDFTKWLFSISKEILVKYT